MHRIDLGNRLWRDVSNGQNTDFYYFAQEAEQKRIKEVKICIISYYVSKIKLLSEGYGVCERINICSISSWVTLFV